MIIALVQFNLPKGVDRKKALEIFQAVAPKFQGMPGLIRKNFLFNGETGIGGGVYLWKDRETAEKVYAEGGACARRSGATTASSRRSPISTRRCRSITRPTKFASRPDAETPVHRRSLM